MNTRVLSSQTVLYIEGHEFGIQHYKQKQSCLLGQARGSFRRSGEHSHGNVKFEVWLAPTNLPMASREEWRIKWT